MSATKTTKAPVEKWETIPDEGGLPTEDELARIWKAVADVEEFGLDVLVERVARTYIAAYETEHGSEGHLVEGATYEYAAIFRIRARQLVEITKVLHDSAKKLHSQCYQLEEAAFNNGQPEAEPKVGLLGGKYEPSREAMRTWGYEEATIERVMQDRRWRNA